MFFSLTLNESYHWFDVIVLYKTEFCQIIKRFYFRVNEGEVGALVGQVKAVDADIGQNALVTYSIKVIIFQ